MERLIAIYWRDIPAQVIGRRGRRSLFKRVLDPRFERATMRAGRGSSQQYLEDWRRESRPCGTDLESEVAEEVSRLEALFPADILERVIRAGGIAKAKDG